MIRLGLIGENISRSRSPLLHRLAGELCGVAVSYEPLIPTDMGLGFDQVFDDCAANGFRGVNVTHPFKEQVVGRVEVADPLVRGLGACNTVLFEDHPQGHNTDFSGFVSAFRTTFPGETPGHVAMAGAGGVGKAIGFALAELQASALTIHDPDPSRAEALRDALARHAPGLPVRLAPSIAAAVEGAAGLINATPLGMSGKGGSAFPAALIRGDWAFDAVYVPENTDFVTAARAKGLTVMTGWELFFHQGTDAFRLFTGLEGDAAALRAELRAREQPVVAV